MEIDRMKLDGIIPEFNAVVFALPEIFEEGEIDDDFHEKALRRASSCGT